MKNTKKTKYETPVIKISIFEAEDNILDDLSAAGFLPGNEDNETPLAPIF